MTSFIFARAARKNAVTGCRKSPRVAAVVAVAVALVSCAQEPATTPPPSASPSPGSLVYQSGAGGEVSRQAIVLPGEPFTRPVILTPIQVSPWQGKWIDRKRPGTKENPVVQGATTGLTLGLFAMPIGSVALLFWPAAVGLVAGATLAGAVGGALQKDTQEVDDGSGFSEAPDRRAIAEATAALHPDQLLIESTAQALAARTGGALPRLPWQPPLPPEPPGRLPPLPPAEPATDGALQFAIEVLGLSATDEPELFGIFLQVRVQAFDLRSHQLRYERVFAHGPMTPIPEVPRPPAHSLDLMAMDNARLYRHQLTEIIRHVAHLIAEDPALPVARH